MIYKINKIKCAHEELREGWVKHVLESLQKGEQIML
jgi:hypothetical protein